MRVGFIGLGIMGTPMALHLLNAGHQLFVHTRGQLPQAVAASVAVPCASAADVARQAEVVFLMVPDTPDVERVLFDAHGVAAGLQAGGATRQVVVDMSSISPMATKDFAARIQAMGSDYLDAPVSGGQAGAENGQLSVMAGGDEAALARVEPVLMAYSKAVKRMGPSGSGQLAKMVNQIAIAGVVQGLAEAVHFAEVAGLDTGATYDAISKGAAQSWQMDNRWKTMAEGQFEFGFAVDWMRKDLGLVLDEARSNGAHLAMTALVDQFYSEVQAMGGARWDTSSLAARLQARTRTR
jgi:3-hydroxyisobutyrate dehydrogenase